MFKDLHDDFPIPVILILLLTFAVVVFGLALIGGFLHEPPEVTDDGAQVIYLDPGEKLLTVNWERNNNTGHIFVLTRPLAPNEAPQVYRYRTITHSSLTADFEIHEVKP